MDFGSLIGLVLVYALVIMAMITSAGIGAYVDFPSFLITVMGTVGIVIAAFPPGRILIAMKSGLKVFIYSAQPQAELVAVLVDFAVKARRDGILALESAESEMKNEFLRKGVRLAVDGTEPDVIRTILETDLEYMSQRHSDNIAVYSLITDMGPAMGMVGTLVGLVAMLRSMSDPSSIGPAMAVALITTLYGAMMANMTSIPISNRLKIRSVEEQSSRLVMLAGIMSIQAGDNPRIVEQKLNAFLPPTQRKSQFD